MFKPCGRKFTMLELPELVQSLMHDLQLTTAMHEYQQLDTQALIDLLAAETQEYTRAYSRGAQDEIAVRRIVMEALITEIKKRKKEDVLPQNVLSAISPPDQSKQD